MKELIELILQNNDGMTTNEARETVEEMRRRVFEDNESPEDVLLEEGIDADYVPNLIC
jgi:hypothetical protein